MSAQLSRLDLGAWARAETARVAAQVPRGTAMLPARHRVMFGIAATGVAGMDDNATMIVSACGALARLEREVERVCVRFCAKENVTPVIPMLVLVQVLSNIRSTYALDPAPWLEFIAARLGHAKDPEGLLALAEEVHRQMLAKMPRRE